MRVQLIGRAPRRRPRDEQGAVALMAAALATILCLLAAFTVDLGVAYTSKRKLQTATDSGALAAAAVYKGQTRPCTQLITDSGLKTLAQQAADKWAAQNRVGMTGSAVQLSCSGKSLTVTYQASGSTPAYFARLIGTEQITTTTIAAATIGAEDHNVGNMRPWGICSEVTGQVGRVVFVPMFGGSTTQDDDGSVCGTDTPPGGWWVAQCNGESNANGATELAVLNGCDPSVGYQAVSTSALPTPVTPQALLAALLAGCPQGTQTATCLGSDPGNNFHNASDEWQTLVGTTFTMPVFCVRPTCSSMAFTAQGNNATYAIEQMATVELCGFELMPSGPSTGWPTTGPCATSNPQNYQASDVTSGGGLFLVIKKLTGGPGGDYQLDEYDALHLTK